jgi:glycosyltransferase involved in cell wall biosynthesis
MKDNNRPYLDFFLLIPFYNNLTGLIRSIQSVRYNPVNYGLLIVDDGSKMALQLSDLAAYIQPGQTVKIIRLPENQGITKALNTGLEWLKKRDDFRFVARLDCGDLCIATRFQTQIDFLTLHPDIDLVGSWCVFKNFSTGFSYRYITPTEHKKILRGMYFRNLFIHPTVMWKADVTGRMGEYPGNFPHAEDYGFFYQILNKGKGAIIPEELVICEINPKGISLHFRKEQLKSRMQVVKQYGKNWFFSLLGVLKIWVLLAIPYRIVFQAKKVIYGIKPGGVIEGQKQERLISH